MAVHEDEYIQRRHVYEEYAYVLDYLPMGGEEKSPVTWRCPQPR